MKKILIGIGVIIGILAVIIFGIVQITKDWQEPETIYHDINLQNIADGTYNGSYIAKPIEVEVAVSVKNNVITDIKILKHSNGRGKDAESITDIVIKEQSLLVEVISGATASSKSILKAIENALFK
jgi:uncharacterized protein with FMN-binding domain